MTGLLVIAPAPVAAVNTTGGDPSQTNLLTNDPKEIYVRGSALDTDIVLDMGSEREVDSFFLGFTNANGDEQFHFASFTSIAAAGQVPQGPAVEIRPEATLAARPSVLVRAPAPFSTRYVGGTVSGGTSPWQIGRALAGLAFEASWDIEWNSGRRVIDTSKVTSLQGGGFGVEQGARKAAYSWTFGDLTNPEVEALWDIVSQVGLGNPLVVVEPSADGSRAQERTHYGLLRSLDKYERREPQASKWSFEIEEWI